MIPDLHKVGLILASGMILSPETVIDNVDNIDVEDIAHKSSFGDADCQA